MSNRYSLLLILLWAGVVGCSGGSPDGSGEGTTPSQVARAPGASGSRGTGTVSVQLTLPGGENISQVDWSLTGPNGSSTVVTSGIETVDALAVRFLVGAINVASGYRFTLSGRSSHGVTCTGLSAPFNIAAQQTTTVAVAMACSSAPAGSMGTTVNGQTYDCAALTGVSASPNEVSVGGSVMLAGTADAPSPGNLTFAWTASSGSFSAPSSSAGTFTCTAPGVVPVTVTVGDGPLPAGAFCNPATTTMTIDITCDASDAGAGVDSGSSSVDAGSSSGDGGSGPPPVVPAAPPWALALLCAGLAALGLRRSGAMSRSR